MNIINLIKSVAAAVRAVEELLPDSGKGAEKLAAVRAMLEGVISDFETRWPQIEKIIGAVVGLYNALAVFRK